MTILVITNRALSNFSNGYDLRVWYLCQALSQREKLVQLVLLQDCQQTSNADMQPTTLFSEIHALPAIDKVRSSPFRHLRMSEADFFKLGYPEFYKTAVREIETQCKKHGIEKIVVFGSNLAEFVRDFSGSKKILFEVCDSVVLTAERQFNASNEPGIVGRLKRQLLLWRWKRLEGKLPHWFDRVATINKADSATVATLAGGQHQVAIIPNGVDPSLEGAYQEGKALRKGVAFWGNLSFAPNLDAVRFFYYDVYLPYLKPAGVEWCVVGRDAESWLIEAARHDEGIRLTGYVVDLRALLIEYPVMVNPMRMGSGMKNKVLEAFAMGLAVVTTALGIESIDGVLAGRDYMAAENPEQFAKAIVDLLEHEDMRLNMIRSAREIVLQQYTWTIVGRHWVDLFNEL